MERDAYCPLPTLVQAARELFIDGKVRPIHRAHAQTQPAIDEIARIAHEAASTHTRHLVLVTGVPGSGKTLVGLSAVHNPALDDLAVERAGGKPSAPAIFLSGNGPLVQVLQYELRGAGGGGKTFVRDVKNYVKQYLGDGKAIPPQHVIVYDEAQRAWDLDQVMAKHSLPFPQERAGGVRGLRRAHPGVVRARRTHRLRSGDYVGEEAGLGQWRVAIEMAGNPSSWTVHAPQKASMILRPRFETRRAISYGKHRRALLSSSPSNSASTSPTISTTGSEASEGDNDDARGRELARATRGRRLPPPHVARPRDRRRTTCGSRYRRGPGRPLRPRRLLARQDSRARLGRPQQLACHTTRTARPVVRRKVIATTAPAAISPSASRSSGAGPGTRRCTPRLGHGLHPRQSSGRRRRSGPTSSPSGIGARVTSGTRTAYASTPTESC